MRRISSLVLAVLAVPAIAFAKAPEPKKPIEVDRFMGRWYELLYTPSSIQKDCMGAHQVWSREPSGKFTIVLTCVKGPGKGDDKTVKMSATAIDPDNNKFEASFFGGLIKQKYWVLDHADDYSWMIACTSGGNFAALLSRQPAMAPGELNTHRAGMAAMGLDITKLVTARNAP